MKKGFRWNKKGISTVIATIIIVAIAIVMAIAVAYWAMGIGASFTRFEKIQFTYSYAITDNTINLGLKNTGSAPATLDRGQVFINAQPLSVASVHFNNTASTTLTLQPGDTAIGTLDLSGYSAGTTIDVNVVTAAGNQYPQVVVLP